MSIKKSFVTSDGKNYSSEDEAKRHQEVVDAEFAYRNAKSAMYSAVAESMKTADGHEFNLSVMNTYYYITHNNYSPPEIKRIPYIGHNFDIDERDYGMILLRESKDQYLSRFRVENLYKHERNAKSALIEALDEWISDKSKLVKEIKRDIA